jgi:hypothetical protein
MPSGAGSGTEMVKYMKTKGDIEIGKRFVEELYRLFPNYSNRKIANMLDVDRRMINEWWNGMTPGGIFFAKILYFGGDVEYILIGKRKQKETAPDFLAEYEEEYD